MNWAYKIHKEPLLTPLMLGQAFLRAIPSLEHFAFVPMGCA
ncbi:MAG: hypothetical protein U0X74_14970 [Anaerolineales bacterium]